MGWVRAFKDGLKRVPLVLPAYWTLNRFRNALFRGTNVVMLHPGRCGSTVVADLLDQHPRVYWAKELFLEYMNRPFERTPRWIERHIERSRAKSAKPVYGFESKYLPEQELGAWCLDMPLAEYLALLRRLRFNRFIVLHRKNYLRRAVSAKVGLVRQKWERASEEENARAPEAPDRVALDVGAFRTGAVTQPLIELFRSLDAQHVKARELLDPAESLFLTYEDDIEDDPRKAYRQICAFLKIPPGEPAVRLKRTNPFPWRTIVQNPGDVEAALRGTEYAWMLEE